MFNNQTKEDKMSEEKNDNKTFWLVIEKYVYSNSTPSHSVKKTATSVEEAIGFKLALEKLNEQKDVSYFLASDVDTVMNNVISAHNQSVKTKEVA
tara:strand:+ start:94 stop:378 length:285 start_codon:yes stop_codon:yes gene_type:complete